MGKSTVVNRLAKRFKDGSIVFDESGVTRDRTYKRAWYCGKDYDVVDTGGLVFDDKGGDVFAKEVRSGDIERSPGPSLNRRSRFGAQFSLSSTLNDMTPYAWCKRWPSLPLFF